MRRKANKTANINANLYDGDFQLGYDCVGVVTCRFGLCYVMPPSGDEECIFREYGSCTCQPAQQEALEALRKRIDAELKQMREVAE